MNKLEKGYIQIYTGNGEGEPQLRSGKLLIHQVLDLKHTLPSFMKEYPYNELENLKLLQEWITIEQFAGDDFVYRKELPNVIEWDKTKAWSGVKAKSKMLKAEN